MCTVTKVAEAFVFRVFVLYLIYTWLNFTSNFLDH